MSRGLRVAVVGLGFGEDFVPVYLAHPDVAEVGLVDLSPARLAAVGDRFGLTSRYARFEEVISDDYWDAVHVLAPVSFHASYTLAALRAGKHVACAVPMATSLEDLEEIVQEQRTSGLQYMMMETSVYAREFRAVQRLHEHGGLGDLTMYRGVHIQNIDGYPRYWLGFPPMHYLTHALSPALALTGRTVRDVVAYGSGRLTEDRVGESGNPFPSETGLFRLNDHDLVTEVTMSFFQAARPYTEGFNVYGSARSVEWPSVEGEAARLHELLELDLNQPETGLRGRRSRTSELVPDDGAELLPEELRPLLHDYLVEPRDESPAEVRRAEHGGSHPHLVDAFVRAVVTGSPAWINAPTAASWTAPGVCAHESALRHGERVEVPRFT